MFNYRLIKIINILNWIFVFFFSYFVTTLDKVVK